MHCPLIQFVKFGLVGASNTLLYLAVYYAFIAFRPEWYLAGNLTGWVVSVFNAWFWNRRYVFDEGESSPIIQLLKSYAAYGSTAILGTILMWISVEFFSVSEWLAPWLTLVITIPLNFVINKFWTFQ